MGYSIVSIDHYLWYYKKDEQALLQHIKSNWTNKVDQPRLAKENNLAELFAWYDWELESGNDEQTGEEIVVLTSWSGDRLGDMGDFFETCAKYLHGYARWRGEQEELFEWRFENGELEDLGGNTYYGDLTDFFIKEMKDELPSRLLKELEQWQTAKQL